MDLSNIEINNEFYATTTGNQSSLDYTSHDC